MADEITQADRELLAAEYERNGLLAFAKAVRANRVIRRDAVALRAIAAARRQGQVPSGGEVVAWRMTDGEGGYEYRDALPSKESQEWSSRYGRTWEPLYTAPPSAPVGVDRPQGDQLADIVADWFDKKISAEVAMVAIRRHLERCYMQPANDYNRGWVAGADCVTARVLAQQPAAKPFQCPKCKTWQTGQNMERAWFAQQPPAEAQPGAPVGVEGTWLWCKLMDWCKEQRLAPATQDKLFAIAGEAHKLNKLAQQSAAVDGVCESAADDCGPVAHYDSDGVPLCERCYRSLEASP